jgi:hypothetical protein
MRVISTLAREVSCKCRPVAACGLYFGADFSQKKDNMVKTYNRVRQKIRTNKLMDTTT